MKFDYIVGNPPYQDETNGGGKNYSPPIYDKFMDESYKVCDHVMLIHPARFLFNAGSTPKSWNEKMLANQHLKVCAYFQTSSDVFPDTSVEGGIAVTYYDANRDFGPIGTFTAFEELNSILHKVIQSDDFSSFSSVVVTRTAYRLTRIVHQEHPEAASQLSDGHLYDMSTNIFDILPQIFYDKIPDDEHDYIRIFGRECNERVYRYVRSDFVNCPKDLHSWKVFVPANNGAPALRDSGSTPVIGVSVIGEPHVGHTESFLSVGCFDNRQEADNCLKYINSKFVRVLVGILKVTPNNPPKKWEYVPLQNFTSNSDIDWTLSISEIDQQLYRKYGLTQEEIEFIETHVKEMT